MKDKIKLNLNNFPKNKSEEKLEDEVENLQKDNKNVDDVENIEEENQKEFPENSDYLDDFQDKEIAKQYKSLKLKKFAIIGAFFVFTIGLTAANVYMLFIRKDMPASEMARQVNMANYTTNFPVDGVMGYLKRNINIIAKENMTNMDGVQEYEINPNSIEISFISKKTNTIANIYFTATIKTNNGEEWHNFTIPLFYDTNKLSYNTAGELQLTPSKINESVDGAENPISSFLDDDMEKESTIKSATTFLENFFTLVYNTKGDYSQFYTGKDKLGDKNVKFVSIEEVDIYKHKNTNGYNGKVTYVVELQEGVRYTTISYIDIERSGNSWIINKII